MSAGSAAAPPALSFDAISDAYDAARPDYPPDLFAALYAAVRPSPRVLEVGCGTGLATQALAQWPHSAIVALDPGPQMIAHAARRVAEADGVGFVEAAFEAWRPDAEERFDLICAAQSWHWVDPTIGYANAAQLLAPQGLLAIFGNVPGDPRGSAAAGLAPVFAAAFGDRPWSLAQAAYAPGGFIARAIAESGLFTSPQHRSWTRAVAYGAADYAAVVATHSSVQALAPGVRTQLLDGLVEAICATGGVVTIDIATHAWLARPVASLEPPA